MHKRSAFLFVLFIFLLTACRPAPADQPAPTPTGTPSPQDRPDPPAVISSETQAAQPPTQIQPVVSLGVSIQALAISPDSKILAAGTQGGIVLIDQSSWSVGWQSRLSRANNAVAFSPDGWMLAAASDTGRITLWQVESPDPVRVLSGPPGSAGGAAFSPDGRLFAAGFSRTVQIWDTQSWQKILTLGGHNNVIWRLAFSKNGRTLASASTDQTVLLWDMTQPGDQHTPVPWLILRSPTYWLRSIAFSPDDLTIAGASGDGVVYIWDAANGERLKTLKGEQGFIWDVAYSPAGGLLAAASEDGSVVLWDASRGEMLQKWHWQSPLHAIVFDPLSANLYSGSADGYILIIPYE